MKNFHEIIINYNDKNLEDQCSKFIIQLEKDYERFYDKLNKSEEEYNKFVLDNKKNNIIIDFVPENVSLKSPLTIIDAPWGEGKTFFIESLVKYIANKDSDIKSSIFKKIIIIDAWKYSSTKDVPNELMIELFSKIVKIKSKKKTIDKFTKFLNQTFIARLNNKWGTEIKLEEWDEEKEIIKEINKEIYEPVLIFLDNIERLEENTWEVMKAIQKMSSLKNFMFVLPMNRKNLDTNKSSNYGEEKIDKYISLTGYKFKQNYIGLLKEKGFNEPDIDSLNRILQNEINDEKISVRDLYKYIEKQNLNEEFKKSFFHGFYIFKDFFQNNEIIKNEIKNRIEEFTNEKTKKFMDIFDSLSESLMFNILIILKKTGENLNNFTTKFRLQSKKIKFIFYEKQNELDFLNSYFANYNNIKIKKFFLFFINSEERKILIILKNILKIIKNDIKNIENFIFENE
ncbi:MAG: P-loop NTPase fold protein, partial [Metamycoplasmataceae bacterium]